MSVTIIRGDITRLEVDAIVNAANNELRGGGGVDGAIHAAAGAEQLHSFCKTMGGCPTGEAKLSPGFNLPAKYIIHTVGPVWQGGAFHEKMLLTSCYLRSLELAQQENCKSVAFPLISAGAYGYPYDDALQIAYDTCQRFLSETKADMEIYIVLYQREQGYNANVRRHTAYSRLPDPDVFRQVAEYIRDNYHFDAEEAEQEEAPENVCPDENRVLYSKHVSMSCSLPEEPDIPEPAAPRRRAAKKAAKAPAKKVQKNENLKLSLSLSDKKPAPDFDAETCDAMEIASSKEYAPSAGQKKRHASSALHNLFDGYYPEASRPPGKGTFHLEKTFSELVIYFMIEKNMTAPEVYKAACIDRKLFSKIISDPNYQPTKNTAVKLALALRLSPEETDLLLNAAGFVLSKSKLSDLVISFCISNNRRAVWLVNDTLEYYGLSSL